MQRVLVCSRTCFSCVFSLSVQLYCGWENVEMSPDVAEQGPVHGEGVGALRRSRATVPGQREACLPLSIVLVLQP